MLDAQDLTGKELALLVEPLTRLAHFSEHFAFRRLLNAFGHSFSRRKELCALFSFCERMILGLMA